MDTHFTARDMLAILFVQADQVPLHHSGPIGCKSVRRCLIPNLATVCVDVEYAHGMRKREPGLDTAFLRHAKAMQ